MRWVCFAQCRVASGHLSVDVVSAGKGLCQNAHLTAVTLSPSLSQKGGGGCRLSAGVCLEAVLILSNMSFIPVVLSAIPVIFAHLLRRIAGYAPLQTDKYASKIQLNTAVDKIKTASWLLLPFCFLPLCFLIGRAGGGIFQSGTLFDTAPLYVWRPLVVCLCFAFGVPIWLCLAKNH